MQSLYKVEMCQYIFAQESILIIFVAQLLIKKKIKDICAELYVRLT